MKITLTFLILLTLAIHGHAQTIVPKTTVVVKIAGGMHPVELDKNLVAGQWHYTFLFQNRSYSELTDIKTMGIDTSGLREMVKGLKAAQAAKNGEDVLMDHFSISKTKTFVTRGAVLYRFTYDAGYCNLSEKDLNKLITAIEKELSL